MPKRKNKRPEHDEQPCNEKEHEAEEPPPPPGPNLMVTSYVTFEGCGERTPLRRNPNLLVSYDQFKSEEQLPRIMEMMIADLSEPYSIFTYRYFINNWPDLCFLARVHDPTVEDPNPRIIGAIVCKLDYHKIGTPHQCIRGYLAMLAVEKEYRGNGIASALVCHAIDTMVRKNCDEVVLETEVTNLAALGLYEELGFVRDKRLHRYYLNGVDAYRLKLWLHTLAL
eukprot:NODE_1626_length_922_cov_257.088202_g1138_i0.p1 GENE.NODE_1626_length_922_cov_257.088202_g1138_i0~~NODE_1626_length_922_cov_257.088202_g1138_i0.p1  ORF type:complete len:225 (+),score=48.12 NODE_1626_length_922_cov_257.088202_g1138_i0:58-732(+)